MNVEALTCGKIIAFGFGQGAIKPFEELPSTSFDASRYGCVGESRGRVFDSIEEVDKCDKGVHGRAESGLEGGGHIGGCTLKHLQMY